MHVLTVILVALAVYRATILLLKDYIFEPLRSRMRACGSRHLNYLSECPWCCSMWAGAVIVTLTELVSWFVYVDLVLAASATTAILYERVNE